MRHEGFVDNEGVHIHYMCMRMNPYDGVTIVVIPGMVEPAEEYENYFKNSPILNAVFISIRGRGKSDAPDHGYSFEAQLSDVSAVIEHLGLRSYIILGFSVGASFAIAHALKRPKQVQGLVIVDYPPHYPSIPEGWIAAAMESGRDIIPLRIARALVRESDRVVMSRELPMIQCPTLVVRGAKEGSLLPAEIAALYTDRIPQCTMLVLENMGHDPFEIAGKDFMNILSAFERRVASGL